MSPVITSSTIPNVTNDTSAAKSSSHTIAASNQLKWARWNFLACTRYTNNYRLTPTTVCTFKCWAHDIGVTNTFKWVINPPTGHVFNNDFLYQDDYDLSSLQNQFARILLLIYICQRFVSTTIIQLAFFAPCTTARPIPLNQRLQRYHPLVLWLYFWLHLNQWSRRNPIGRRVRDLASGLILAKDTSATTVYSEKVEQPM